MAGYSGDHFIIRELQCPKAVNHDQFVAMVSYQDYIFALQSRLAQVVVFKATTMELMRRVDIPNTRRMTLRGICIDEPNNKLYLCTTSRLLCVQLQSMLVLESPDVDEIDVSSILESLEAFTGTLTADHFTGSLYMATSTTSTGETTYSIVKLRPFFPKEHVRINLGVNISHPFMALHTLSESTTLAFSAIGEVISINKSGMAASYKRLESVFSLRHVMFDPVNHAIYTTNMRVDRIWTFFYGTDGFVKQGHFDTQHLCVQPAPVCFLPQDRAVTLFDNQEKLFKKWSFSELEDFAPSCTLMPIVDEYDSTFMQSLSSPSSTIPSLAELHHGRSPEFFLPLEEIAELAELGSFLEEEEEASVKRMYRGISFSADGVPMPTESPLMSAILHESSFLPELPILSPNFDEDAPLLKKIKGVSFDALPDLAGLEFLDSRLFGYDDVKEHENFLVQLEHPPIDCME
jgi:hypothetical protein